jgi:hypothetical protein
MYSESFLTLDETTLQYVNLSNSRNKGMYADRIKDWRGGVEPPSPSGPRSRTSENSSRRPPSLTVGSTWPSKTSTTTSKLVAKRQPDVEYDGVRAGGIPSDDEEINGPEHEFAVNSPPKGKRRLTSAVRPQISVYLLSNVSPRAL